MTGVQAGRQDAWMQRFREGSDAYRAWLPSIFTGPRAVGDHWNEAFEDEQQASADEWCFRMGAMCARCGTDLHCYSDEALGNGLWCLFSSSISDMTVAVCQPVDDRDLQLAALASIGTLYRDCLEPRCKPVLGHHSSGGRDPLSMATYMMWDLGLPLRPEKTDERPVVLHVLASTLDSPNIACIESGLHGLSHFAFRSPEAKAMVQAIIEPFLVRRQDIPAELRAYAQAAMLGYCQ